MTTALYQVKKILEGYRKQYQLRPRGSQVEDYSEAFGDEIEGHPIGVGSHGLIGNNLDESDLIELAERRED